MSEPVYVDRSEAASILRVQPRTLDEWARIGQLPTGAFQLTPGGRRQYNVDVIRDYAMERLKVKPKSKRVVKPKPKPKPPPPMPSLAPPPAAPPACLATPGVRHGRTTWHVLPDTHPDTAYCGLTNVGWHLDGAPTVTTTWDAAGVCQPCAHRARMDRATPPGHVTPSRMEATP